MSFEHLFTSSSLNVVIPDTSVEYPPQTAPDDWLERLQSSQVERKQAFFDEQLQVLLTFCIEHPTSASPVDRDNPPSVLLSFLSHIQISLEATYISPAPAPSPEPRVSKLSAPPRTSSPAKTGSRLQLHPSILPPNTPNPTPSSADHDRKYVTSEGTLLLASIWGQSTSEDSTEALSLLWSDKQNAWVAIYRLSFTVAFLRLNFLDPLLCVTVSATLREKPLALTQPKHPFTLFLASIGQTLITPDSPAASDEQPEQKEDELEGLEEVNLLEGLFGGPTFSNTIKSPVYLPTTRLGTVSRQKLFSLSPVSLPAFATPSPSPMTAVRTAHPTLRKSFRKTLHAVSGFRVRMRTVFVPYILLPNNDGSLSHDEAQAERERQEALNEERTVVLCVEVENSGESGTNIGFMVEKVDVKIEGDGAHATLIGWGDRLFGKDAEQKASPLLVGPMSQYNLLYAVSFLRSPEEIEGFSLSKNQNNLGRSELQRAVTIYIYGKPYEILLSSIREDSTKPVSYPTKTFSSRWNCVLDLSSNQMYPLDNLDTETGDFPGGHHALPEPASPFPTSAPPRTPGFTSPTPNRYSAGSMPQPPATAGTKRHTVPGGNIIAARSIKEASTPNRASTSMLNPGNLPSRQGEQLSLPGPSRASYAPPSITTQAPRTPTTYSAPPPPPLPDSAHPNKPLTLALYDNVQPPMTPAYPAYPSLSPLPPTPMSQGPIASHSTGNVGPSVEILRERGIGMSSAPVPQTPMPLVTGGFGEQQMFTRPQNVEESGESIVVSVGLLPPINSTRRKQSESEIALGSRKIYPLDYFTLDIFVFNQSEWTRRFEVTCPDGKRRRRVAGVDSVGRNQSVGPSKKMGFSGILPVDARVRIGPLRPSACQSVRMEFLAITPGVHSIDALTLTDVETGFSMNLRSVMDVVVHDLNN